MVLIFTICLSIKRIETSYKGQSVYIIMTILYANYSLRRVWLMSLWRSNLNRYFYKLSLIHTRNLLSSSVWTFIQTDENSITFDNIVLPSTLPPKRLM